MLFILWRQLLFRFVLIWIMQQQKKKILILLRLCYQYWIVRDCCSFPDAVYIRARALPSFTISFSHSCWTMYYYRIQIQNSEPTPSVLYLCNQKKIGQFLMYWYCFYVALAYWNKHIPSKKTEVEYPQPQPLSIRIYLTSVSASASAICHHAHTLIRIHFRIRRTQILGGCVIWK